MNVNVNANAVGGRRLLRNSSAGLSKEPSAKVQQPAPFPNIALGNRKCPWPAGLFLMGTPAAVTGKECNKIPEHKRSKKLAR